MRAYKARPYDWLGVRSVGGETGCCPSGMTPPKLLKNCRREGGEKTWLRVALRQPLVGEYAIFSLIPFRLGWMRELEAFTLPDWFMFSSAGGGDESIGRTEPDESW